MNVNLGSVLLFIVGTILIYSAVKNKDPRDVIRESMGKTAQRGPISGLGERGGEVDPTTPLVPGVPI